MTHWDWFIVLLYLVFAVGLGLFLRKKLKGDVENFFLSNRSFPWWVLGISMVATTYAADTPLAVTGLVRREGLAGNWIWWNMAIGWAIAVFFYAPLWRRAGLVTDAEFVQFRYCGSGAFYLRKFYAVYNGLIINVIVSSWVIKAMSNILRVWLGWQEVWPVLILLIVAAGFYAVLSGFWGVVVTDLFQFFFALIGAVLLAYFSVMEAGGLDALSQSLDHDSVLSFWPDFSAEGVLWTFVAFVAVQWWAQRESSMPGYFAQRMFAARSDDEARKSALLFNYLHYAVRPWPWLLVALASLVIFTPELLQQKLAFLPEAQRGEAAYALMIRDLLPEGIRGFVAMSLVAAFMSTIDTQANWGASYIIQDLYLPRRQNARDREILWASRLVLFAIIVLAALVSLLLDSVEQAWKFLFAFTAGIGPVYLLRWYWSRINAWSELTAMLGGAFFTLLITSTDWVSEAYSYPAKLGAAVVGSALLWLPVTLLTAKSSPETLRRFYARIHLRWPMERLDELPHSEEGWGVALPPTEKSLPKWRNVFLLLVAIASALWGGRELLLGDVFWGAMALIFSVLFLGATFVLGHGQKLFFPFVKNR